MVAFDQHAHSNLLEHNKTNQRGLLYQHKSHEDIFRIISDFENIILTTKQDKFLYMSS